DNGNNHTFTAPNLAKSLNSTLVAPDQYLSFVGYAESLPRDGDTTTRIASDPDPTSPPDLYMRNYNPMAQFTDVGAHGTTALTTIIVGDPRLVVPGNNGNSVNHYNVLRTIEDMYGLTPLANTATAAPLTTNDLGQLAPTGQVIGPQSPTNDNFASRTVLSGTS